MVDDIRKFFTNIRSIKQPILTEISSGTVLNGKELLDLVDKTAAFLEENNVKPKDTFLCLADNNIETALLVLAAMRHGCCASIVPSNFDKQDLALWNDNLSASAIIDTREDSASACANGSSIHFRCAYLADLKQKIPQDVDDNLPFIITFTSGTTGSQKAIYHQASSFINCAEQFNDVLQISENDRFLNFMPMHYMAGIFNGFIAPLERGAAVLIAPAFSIETVLNLHAVIDENKITSMWISPSMLAMLVKLDRSGKNFSSTLKNVFVGTGSLEKELAIQFHSSYGLPALQSYGLSELLYVSVDRKDSWMAGTCGQPITGVDVLISKDGTAIIRSPYRFLGWMEKGEFHHSQEDFQTNDLVQFDSNGRLQILGRQDEMIIRGGFNISPEAVEQKIKALIPSEFCVLGYPHSDLGHCIVLAMVGTSVDGDEIKSKCNEVVRTLGNISIDFVVAVDTIPKTVTGKIKRKLLRQTAQNILGQK